nr:hypothetical protein [Tanacetum cinerariifolium]
MLDKDLYDSWKSRMELYIQNRDHGRMILESAEHDPLIWPTVKENGVYHQISIRLLIMTELPRINGREFNYLCKYYLRSTQLINDMNIYNMNLEQFQVNTKFLNRLPPEWSKFMTDVKLVKDLHTTNFDQLHAYLEQPELHANEVRLLREHNQDPLAFKANQQMTPPHFNTYQSSYNNPQLQQQFSPSQYGSIHPTQHYSSTYLSQPQFNHSYKSNATSSGGNNSSGHARVVKCYNCQGKGHIARQCTQPKRPRNAAWYKDKAMLAEAQEAGQILACRSRGSRWLTELCSGALLHNTTTEDIRGWPLNVSFEK